MLLKLIKTESFISGTHAELWEINHLTGNHHLANVFLLNEHVPLELIFRLTLSHRGICIQGKVCGWEWTSPMERLVTEYLLSIQHSQEEIYIEICAQQPALPGYPETDYHPRDYPVVLVDYE